MTNLQIQEFLVLGMDIVICAFWAPDFEFITNLNRFNLKVKQLLVYCDCWSLNAFETEISVY